MALTVGVIGTQYFLDTQSGLSIYYKLYCISYEFKASPACPPTRIAIWNPSQTVYTILYYIYRAFVIIDFIWMQQMHYTLFQWFIVPTYVSAYLLPSPGGSSRVHNLQYIQLFFTHFHSFRVLWKWVKNSWMYWRLWTFDDPPEDGKRYAETCRGKKSLKESVVHLLDWNKIN
jgi:hypothetical protein